MSVYIVKLLQVLKKCPIMISSKHCISATTEGNVVDTIYVGELETPLVLTYHCATCSVRPGPLFIALYLALNAEGLDTPEI